jgi:hypothetical protein
MIIIKKYVTVVVSGGKNAALLTKLEILNWTLAGGLSLTNIEPLFKKKRKYWEFKLIT